MMNPKNLIPTTVQSPDANLSCKISHCDLHSFLVYQLAVSAGDPVPATTGAEPDESEGLARLNKGHGPGVTETGLTEENVLLPLSIGSTYIMLLLSSPRRLLYISISLTQDLHI